MSTNIKRAIVGLLAALAAVGGALALQSPATAGNSGKLECVPQRERIPYHCPTTTTRQRRTTSTAAPTTVAPTTAAPSPTIVVRPDITVNVPPAPAAPAPVTVTPRFTG